MALEDLAARGDRVGGANHGSENIKVAIRLRPFTEKEKQRNNRRIVDIEQQTVVLFSPKYNDVSLKKFTFDHSYWSHDGFKKDANGVNVPDEGHPNSEKYVGQEKVFQDLGHFLLTNALEGYNSALLAYGQTGSGKSYTVTGYGKNEGILPRFARSLFEELDKKVGAVENNVPAEDKKPEGRAKISPNASSESEAQQEASDTPGAGQNNKRSRYEVYFSMIEIYNEVVRDLLAKNHGDIVGQTTFARRGLKVREHPKHGFFVENLTSYACADKAEIEQRIEEGQLNKSIAATSMNETSSRGHTIYEFRIKQYKLKGPESQTPGASDETLTTSVVQLVDLAGSERLAVHVTGQLGGDSFIGGRSSSPFVRAGNNERSRSVRNGSSMLNSAQPVAAASASTAQQPSASTSTSSASTSSIKRNGQNNHMSLYVGHDHHKRFKESVSINQSLSALGNCIQVLSHYSQSMADPNSSSLRRAPPKIPYRDSVLTKLLNRCCLSGNSRVVIIATLSPADANYDDTLSTLRFADRAKRIQTHATVNRTMSRSEKVENLQKENDRLKQLVDGRVTRSDDSSQTSNFDDSENVMENFTGSKINHQDANSAHSMATPIRGRTTIRKSRADQHKTVKRGERSLENPRLMGSTSNPSLAVNKEQMNRLVSPASKKMTGGGNSIHKSRSIAHGLSHSEQVDGQVEVDDLEEIDLNDMSKLVANYEDDELADIKEGLISPDSDEASFSANLVGEDLTNEEKIAMFNRLLTDSTANNGTQERRNKQSPTKYDNEQAASNRQRPKKANQLRSGMRQVSIMSSSLKKSNPYLSNLNQDEQLTGMISYIIKQGDTIVGKSNDCDIVLHGTELRGQHAKITRTMVELSNRKEGSNESFAVYIEPIIEEEVAQQNAAILVNGSPIDGSTKLNHCDRLLFGTNSYFVFIDNVHAANTADGSDTVADLDLVTFDMARNEVLRKVMAEAKNEAMIKEIKDYTHRPGTGKHRPGTGKNRPGTGKNRTKPDDGPIGDSKVIKEHVSKVSRSSNSRLARSMTINDQDTGIPIEDLRISSSVNVGPIQEASPNIKKQEEIEAEKIPTSETPSEDADEIAKLEADYREQLMEDTYEYAMPVAEVNAVAKEMSIKVNFGLKILTGEEQLPEQMAKSYLDSNTSDGYSSSSAGGESSHNTRERLVRKDSRLNDQVTQLDKLDGLDLPPALFIETHLEERDMKFYWSKEKFQARRFKIMELYGAWDVGGKAGLVDHLIDQSRTQGNYLIDPFIDEPTSTPVLIGHAQITLQPIAHLADINQHYDILDLDDETIGSISVKASPCHTDKISQENGENNYELYRPYTEDEMEKGMLTDPSELLNKELLFLLKIVSCKNIPEKFCNVYCQYTLKSDRSVIRTGTLRNDEIQDEGGTGRTDQQVDELKFNHSHYIYFNKVTRDVLKFFEHGFLTVQIVGHYKTLDSNNNSKTRCPTVVSTIIDSINKYKFKNEQKQSSFHKYASGDRAYNYQSNSDSARSNQGPMSNNAMHSNSGASSVASTSATNNLFDQQTNEDDEGSNSMNGLSQDNIVDMILTKRKLDRAENQLHYLKRTVNIAEHYNKRHIPVKTVKKLLNSYGNELDSGSLDEMAADVTVKGTTNNKNRNCIVQ